jgi:hypothetical protein
MMKEGLSRGKVGWEKGAGFVELRGVKAIASYPPAKERP